MRNIFLLCALLLPFYAFAQDSSVQLPEIVVEEDALKSGSAESGYRVRNVTNFGPWNFRPLVDTPHTITIVPSELITNRGARSSEEIFKINPILNTRDAFDVNNITEINARGFSTKRAYINGVQTDNLGLGVFVEDVENIEILSGLSGFMYGAGNLGGVANFNLKRPKRDEDLTRLIVGNHGGAQQYAHLDMSRRYKSIFGVRANVLWQDGRTNIKDQHLKRELVSGAVDVYATDSLVIELNASKGGYFLDGRQTQFWTGDNNMPGMPAPRNSRRLWGPKETYVNVDTLNGGAGFAYYLNSSVSARASYNHKIDDRNMLYNTTAEIVDNNSAYTYALMGSREKFVTDGGFAYLDAQFETFSIEHKLTTGVNGYYQTTYYGIFDNPHGAVTDGYMIYPRTPTYRFDIDDYTSSKVTIPNWDTKHAPLKKAMYYYNVNYILGDDIIFTDRISMMAGMNYSIINQRNYHPILGSFTNNYTKKAFTPTISLMFKPLRNMTTYVSYIQALERGQMVAPTYENGGQTLPPLISDQYEIGFKADFSTVFLHMSLFRIQKPNQYSDNGTLYGKFVQDGRQVHQGAELTITGRFFKKLTVLTGGTYFDANVEKSNNKALVGKTPPFVPQFLAKIYAEYDTPLDGLTLTGGVFHTGESWANTMNTTKVPYYTTADVGFRYKTRVYDYFDMKLIMNITNVTDLDYWAGQTIGTPFTLSFSVLADFL